MSVILVAKVDDAALILLIFFFFVHLSPPRWLQRNSKLLAKNAKAHGEQGGDQDSQHGFSKGNSCLTNRVAFYDGGT